MQRSADYSAGYTWNGGVFEHCKLHRGKNSSWYITLMVSDVDQTSTFTAFCFRVRKVLMAILEGKWELAYFLPVVIILLVACRCSLKKTNSFHLFLIKYLALGKVKLSFIMLEHEEAKPNPSGWVSRISSQVKWLSLSSVVSHQVNVA